MKKLETKSLSDSDLATKLDEMRKQLHMITQQVRQGISSKKHLIRYVRRDIARLHTELGQRAAS